MIDTPLMCVIFMFHLSSKICVIENKLTSQQVPSLTNAVLGKGRAS